MEKRTADDPIVRSSKAAGGASKSGVAVMSGDHAIAEEKREECYVAACKKAGLTRSSQNGVKSDRAPPHLLDN